MASTRNRPCAYLTIFLCFMVHLFVVCCTEEDIFPRIGIIGAGIGGTSTAYFLRQLFGDKVQIDVYEANKVGGRAALVEFNGYTYEAGAATIFKKNRYMLDFNKLFTVDGALREINPTNFGIYGSDGFVFLGSDSSAITFVKLLLRYGVDLFTMQNWLSGVIIPNFLRIYTLQDNGLAFTTCENLLGAMSEDFVDMTKKTIKEVLLDIGLSNRFIDELPLGIMKDNFGQSTDVHGFVGALSLIGTTSDFWSVIGGIKNIPEFLLAESKASQINGTVTKVSLIQGDRTTYKVDFIKEDTSGLNVTESKEYDIVILATPLNGTRNKIEFVNFPSPVADFFQEYHRTVSMFVNDGKINVTSYNLKDESEFPPTIFVTDDDLFYDHLVKQPTTGLLNISYTSDESTNIWELFLNDLPTEEELNSLFESRGEIKFVDWLAYPEYQPKMDLPTFVLNERLYYLNAIESAASALEMSAIGARNVALLAYNQWYEFLDRIDPSNV